MNIVLAVLIIVAVGVAGYFVIQKNKVLEVSTQTSQNSTMATYPEGYIPPKKEFSQEDLQTQIVAKNKDYKDYISIDIPAGWTLTEVTRTLQNQVWDQVTKKAIKVGEPVTETTGNIEITKGNYSIFISPLFQYEHARPFVYIDGLAAELVTKSTDKPFNAFACAITSDMIIGQFKLQNYYTDSSKKQYSCTFPSDGKPVWFGSMSLGITNRLDPDDAYANYNEYAIFLDYKTDDVNKLPKKDSLELNQFLKEAAAILQTLKFK